MNVTVTMIETLTKTNFYQYFIRQCWQGIKAKIFRCVQKN